MVSAADPLGRNLEFLDGARNSVVVKALCYKPEGHEFESR
jgi:hypothetical protein